MPDLLQTISPFSISVMDCEDTFVWKSVENGTLTIKHAYSFITNSVPQGEWSQFPWDIDTGPAHCMIVWRLLHNRLPTDDNLAVCGLQSPSICSLCLEDAESSKHLFFNYSFASKTWTWLSCNLQLPFTINKLEDCIKILKDSWNPQALAVIKASFAHTISQIWQTRNLLRFENKSIHWKRCISTITAHVKLTGNLTTKKANDSMTCFAMLKAFGIEIHPRRQLCYTEILWCRPPPIGWVKCNIDGAASGSPMLTACGGIFRDDKADHLLSFSAFLSGGTPVFSEFMAAILAIEKAKELNWNKLWIETDCMLLVKAFSNPQLVPWIIKSRWLTCWAYTLNMEFMITHICRGANFCADVLANIGLTNRSHSWFNFVHNDIISDYLLDKVGTPRFRICS
ncbi:uncharacterized protein LOC131650572 [Vicia villosa]|uniref:uncharacterized protein LOC131650572 n=1 Tax=Vicia villosa TaxID=3911 RepID=UPI00273A8C88|nr:uncharacterized protein LOC131650572 [Vicia villosa]